MTTRRATAKSKGPSKPASQSRGRVHGSPSRAIRCDLCGRSSDQAWRKASTVILLDVNNTRYHICHSHSIQDAVRQIIAEEFTILPIGTYRVGGGRRHMWLVEGNSITFL